MGKCGNARRIEKFNVEQYPEKFQAMLHILDHVNTVDQIFKNHLSGSVENTFKTTNSEKTPNLSELQESVVATDKWFVKFVSDVNGERLKQNVQFTFTDGNNGKMTCEEMLLHVITHAGYHRGSVGQILEEVGIGSPPDSLTKFLHKYEPERRART